MSEKYVCPECGKKEVEEINACGASTFFCQSCKKLFSKSKFIAEEKNEKKEEK